MYGTPVKASSLDNHTLGGAFHANANTWGSISKLGGQLKVNNFAGFILTSIQKCGDVISSNQIFCEGFELYQNGKYCLEFDISSSVERMIEYRIQQGVNDNIIHVENCINIDSDVTRVVKTFTVKGQNDTKPRLVFNLGNVQQELSQHDIKISNVRLYLVDDSKIEF